MITRDDWIALGLGNEAGNWRWFCGYAALLEVTLEVVKHRPGIWLVRVLPFRVVIGEFKDRSQAEVAAVTLRLLAS